MIKRKLFAVLNASDIVELPVTSVSSSVIFNSNLISATLFSSNYRYAPLTVSKSSISSIADFAQLFIHSSEKNGLSFIILKENLKLKMRSKSFVVIDSLSNT